jgi:hypothetical protein
LERGVSRSVKGGSHSSTREMTDSHCGRPAGRQRSHASGSGRKIPPRPLVRRCVRASHATAPAPTLCGEAGSASAGDAIGAHDTRRHAGGRRRRHGWVVCGGDERSLLAAVPIDA